jgi:sulfonate transport system permease protein
MKPWRIIGGRMGLAILLPAAILVAWSIGSAAGAVPTYLIPAPWTVARELTAFVLGGKKLFADAFPGHMLATLQRVLTGFGVAVAVGIPAGVLSGRVAVFAALTDPLVQLVRAVPGIAWLPLAMVWFGIGNTTAVFLIALAAFFPVYLNTLHGVRRVPALWVQAARMLGASRRQVLLRVVLPATMPSIGTGLRLALGFSWAYVVLGEMTGVNAGLGSVIMDARVSGDVTGVLVGMICIAVLGRLSDLLLVAALRRMPGHQPATTAAMGEASHV